MEKIAGKKTLKKMTKNAELTDNRVFFTWNMSLEEEYSLTKVTKETKKVPKEPVTTMRVNGDSLFPSLKRLYEETELSGSMEKMSQYAKLASVMACLAYCEPLTNFIRHTSNRIQNKIEGMPFVSRLNDFITSLEAQSKEGTSFGDILSESSDILRNDETVRHLKIYQNILNRMHSELTKKYTFTEDEWILIEDKKCFKTIPIYNDYSPIVCLFQGKMKKNTSSITGSKTIESFDHLDVPIKEDDVDLKRIMESYTGKYAGALERRSGKVVEMRFDKFPLILTLGIDPGNEIILCSDFVLSGKKYHLRGFIGQSSEDETFCYVRNGEMLTRFAESDSIHMNDVSKRRRRVSLAFFLREKD
jgi:hypothetical protein